MNRSFSKRREVRWTHEEDRIVTALRAASSKLFPGVSVACFAVGRGLLGWKRVTRRCDHGYRLLPQSMAPDSQGDGDRVMLTATHCSVRKKNSRLS